LFKGKDTFLETKKNAMLKVDQRFNFAKVQFKMR